jgi:ribosomal protein S18 acetylase RimI-like enzyme
MPIIIRKYTDADFGSVFALEGGMRREPYTQAVFIRQAACLFPSTFLVADKEGEVIGYAIGGPVQGDGSAAWMLRLQVRTDARQKGTGTRLLSTLLGVLASQGASECFLTVSPENHQALPLYRKEGFVVVDRIPGYFGEGEDRLIMRRPLIMTDQDTE